MCTCMNDFFSSCHTGSRIAVSCLNIQVIPAEICRSVGIFPILGLLSIRANTIGLSQTLYPVTSNRLYLEASQ